jgi:hypothetical protein
MENNVFTLKAQTYDKDNLTISYERIKSLTVAMAAAVELSLAFRDVTVTDDTTGEVMYHTYYSTDCFISYLTPGEAITSICDLLKEDIRNA